MDTIRQRIACLQQSYQLAGEFDDHRRFDGKAQIGEDLIDVVSEGPFISAGRKIEILAVSGNRVVVREAQFAPVVEMLAGH